MTNQSEEPRLAAVRCIIWFDDIAPGKTRRYPAKTPSAKKKGKTRKLTLHPTLHCASHLAERNNRRSIPRRHVTTVSRRSICFKRGAMSSNEIKLGDMRSGNEPAQTGGVPTERVRSSAWLGVAVSYAGTGTSPRYTISSFTHCTRAAGTTDSGASMVSLFADVMRVIL